MVDNRSAGFYGIGGAFNFKSGNISGTAARNQDDKMGPGTEYGEIPIKEEDIEQNQQPFVDRSAQLRATLNSLAMMNVANVLNEKKRAEILAKIEEDKSEEDEDKENKELDEEFLNDFEGEDENESEYY
ncbi:MAG: hypothetical protein PHC64_10460 [Candidatus Gastranaerophilales bacterium]|nr:hypothetical protein [Candidatus Gastranaerophilales bacterium]